MCDKSRELAEGDDLKLAMRNDTAILSSLVDFGCVAKGWIKYLRLRLAVIQHLFLGLEVRLGHEGDSLADLVQAAGDEVVRCLERFLCSSKSLRHQFSRQSIGK
jgi:hypothetical protein